MTVQAVGSLMVLGLVIARAVNILKQPRASRLLAGPDAGSLITARRVHAEGRGRAVG